MNKQRKTSHILNVFQYDETTGAVTLPSTLILTAPASDDNSTKVGTTAWVRTYVTGLSYLTGNQSITVSGDATGSGTTSIALTLANTAVTPGTYGSTTLVPVVTVDSKGRITSVTTAAISGSLTFTGDVTGSGTTGTSTGLTLAASGVTAGTYTKVTVDTKGRVTVGASATTSDISEGTNLYYTDTRVGTYLTANSYATQSYVATQVSNLVAAAPATLDTLNELAAALGNDPSFATTVSTSIGTKVPQARTLTINGTTYDLTANRSWTINSMVYPSAGIALSTGSAWGTSITDNSANWNTAYGWGNHASGGYLTSALAATTYASLTGAYANPAFVASLAYSKITGVPAFLTSYTETDPYRVTSVAVSGTSTKTITLTRADASTVTTTWTVIDTDTNTYVTSAGFSGGTLTLTRNDAGTVTVSLDGRYYLATNPSSYITSSSLTSYVPYTGATANIDTGGYSITAGAVTLTSNLWLKNIGTYDFIMSNATSVTTNTIRAYYNTSDELRFYAKNTAGSAVVPKIMVGDGTTFYTLYHTGNLPTIPTNNNQLTNGAGYITGITSGNVTTALGYTPVTNARTITINGTGYDLSADRSWTITATETDTLSSVVGRGNTTGGNIISSANMYASVFYDYADNGYYLDANSYSSLWGLAIRGDNSSTGTTNQITFWGGSMTTTSAIGFKSNGAPFTNPTGNGDGYNTYLTMDTVGRGWVFRRGTGGTDFSAAYTSGWILNNGIWQANASMRAPIFYDSEDTGYYVDPNSVSRMNTIVYDNLKFSGDQTYGLLGRNAYVDTINGRGADPLELNYYDGGSVIIGTGANGSKGLYAGSLYDAGNRVYSAGNPQVNIAGNAATATGQQSSTHFTLNTGGGGYGLVGVYNPDIHQGFYAMGPAYVLGAGGTLANFYGVSWSYDYSGRQLNTGYNLQHCMAVANAGTVYTVIGQGIWTNGLIRANGNITGANLSGTNTGDQTNISGKADGALKLWAASHPNDYYIVNNWTGSHWRLTSNHGSPVRVGYADDTGAIGSSLGNTHYWSGIQYFETNNGGSAVNNSNSAKLQAYSSSNNTAFMSFHRGGYYATNMGLDNDNVFRIGGWSASGNRFQMDMSGNLTMAGDVTAYSDARVKENIATIENALNKVLALRGVSYNRIDSDDKKTKIGVIAQETLPIVPEVVNQDNDGMYNVSYGNLAGLFIEAIKEQQKEIEELKTLIYGITR